MTGPDVPPAFRCEVEPRRQAVIARAIGELDYASVDTLRATVSELLGAGFHHVILDLRQLTFIDSTGLGAVLEVHRSAPADVALEIVRGRDDVHRVFEITGVDALLPFAAAPSIDAPAAPVRAPVPLLCVDDDPEELLILGHWLEREPDFEVVGAVDREDLALAEVARAHPRIVISDTMRGPADPGFLARLRAAAPDVRIVVFSGYADWQLDTSVLRLADATVFKSADRRELLAALRRLAQH